MRDSKRDTDVLNSLLNSVAECEGGIIWEKGIETCKLSYVKRIASPGSMQDTGCSGLGHWDGTSFLSDLKLVSFLFPKLPLFSIPAF